MLIWSFEEAGGVKGCSGVSWWYRLVLLISQSASGGSNIAQQSSGIIHKFIYQIWSPVWDFLLSFLLYFSVFMIFFFFYVFQSLFFLLWTLWRGPSTFGKELVVIVIPSMRTLTSRASAIYCKIHCTSVGWRVWSGWERHGGLAAWSQSLAATSCLLSSRSEKDVMILFQDEASVRSCSWGAWKSWTSSRYQHSCLWGLERCVQSPVIGRLSVCKLQEEVSQCQWTSGLCVQMIPPL